MKRYFLLFILTFFVVLGFLVFGSRLREIFFQPKASFSGLEEKPVVCAEGDIACIGKHARNLADQLQGSTVSFVKHQCFGPHPCPTPDEESISAATGAIRAYTKDSKLDVIPINGVTAAGIIYYCAKDGRCWSVEGKTNRVVSPIKGLDVPSPVKRGRSSGHL